MGNTQNKIVCSSCKNTECEECKLIKYTQGKLTVMRFSNYIFNGKKIKYVEFDYKIKSNRGNIYDRKKDSD